jgi:twitching motility protein PilT
MKTVTLEPALSETTATAVGSCPLFRALKPEQIPQVLKIAELVRYAPDEVVVSEGQPSDSFFVIVDGHASVRVSRGSGETVEIGRIPRPASFGEVGLLLGQPRTATVVASDELEVLRFTAHGFDEMFKKIPGFGIGVCQGLAYRLHQVSGSAVPLPEHDPGQALPAPEVLALLPAEFRQRHRVLPLALEGNVVRLGFVDDPTPAAIGTIRESLPGMEVQPARIPAAFFEKVMHGHAGVSGWKAKAPAAEPAAPRSPQLDALLQRVVAEGASDLHLSAGHKPHWRIDGDIHEIADAPVLGRDEAAELLKPAMAERHWHRFTEDSDADCAYAVPGLARFRVNLFRDHGGSGAVLRQVPSRILTLEQLGLPEVLKTLCEMPKGLVLVTGPTGSGKSTTLAAMIDHINRTRKLHIVTVEDPIEFLHAGAGAGLINQREIGSHTRSFASGLRAALREDPDVVLVGELRDPETIALALEVANTGHLVFATLHTNSAVSTVDRIVDSFPGDQQSQVRNALADSLRGVVTQTLLRKPGGGRLAVCEVLIVTLAIANLIRESKTPQIPGIMQTSRALGMALLNDELARLVEARKLDLDEALAGAIDKRDLQRRFRSGLTLASDPQSPERLRVMAVAAGSPAAEAGLARGDYLLEVAGKPVRQMTLDEVRGTLRGDGTHVLSVDKGGKRAKLTLTLKS